MLRPVSDPRDPRGKIYRLSFVLAVTPVARLAGAKCLRELGGRIADLPQPLLARLGAPFDHFCEIHKTVRLLLETIDVDALDGSFGAWSFAQTTPRPGDQLTRRDRRQGPTRRPRSSRNTQVRLTVRDAPRNRHRRRADPCPR
ncbi:transposase family protein [Frankia sp. AgB32]|uniref:transposase family protein n=1 Tax=Frankia sp. AgB32 TaxID=631119 RepID=UPI00200BFD5C|nr:transposase family protein [Frankia sp. AgB32]MCK9896276.1 transposase family protein [Frankia sp. AgB32]